jgi:carboxyl-terminal processing protease
MVDLGSTCISGHQWRKIMKSKQLIGLSLGILVVLLLMATFVGGLFVGTLLNTSQVSTPFLTGLQQAAIGIPDGESVDRNELFKPFWQAWDLVHVRYIDQPVDDVALMRGAISGMLGALGDQYTSYLDPDMAEKFDARLNGSEYEGIGAWVDISGDYLKIISPMPGSPAEKAGLEAGDIVIAVDGEDMTGIDGDLVLKRIISPKDTQVILTIQREGELEPLDFEITRAVITTPLIESRMLENNIGYVRLYTFGDSTAGDLRNALRELLAQNPQGLVLDLRSNGGGYLAAAIDVASEFIGDGVLLYEEFSDGRRDVLRAESGGLATKIPLVVLVNEGSASASEIVAGAIQDRGRGLLVGVKTFGKGLVQTVHMLENDQGQVRVTTARWLTPNERQINKLGLTPNHIVEVTEEDRQADRDPQLDKAIELLSR